MLMKVVNGPPPNIAKIVKAFPAATKPGIIFTYGDVIYAPGVNRIIPSLQKHEQVHSKQQAAMGVDKWWDLYIDDERFRFNEELAAHRAEYVWWRTHKPRQRRAMLKLIAGRLASELYGNIVCESAAENLIMEAGRGT